MEAHSSHSESASESASSAGTDGAILIGGLIGTTVSLFITTTRTTHTAAHFTTGTTTTMERTCTAELTPGMALLLRTPTQGTGRRAGTSASTAESTTAPAQPRILSAATIKQLEAMLNPMVRAEFTPVPSATTTTVDRQEAFLPAEAAASVAEEAIAQAEGIAAAGTGNPGFVLIHTACEI